MLRNEARRLLRLIALGASWAGAFVACRSRGRAGTETAPAVAGALAETGPVDVDASFGPSGALDASVEDASADDAGAAACQDDAACDTGSLCVHGACVAVTLAPLEDGYTRPPHHTPVKKKTHYRLLPRRKPRKKGDHHPPMDFGGGDGAFDDGDQLGAVEDTTSVVASLLRAEISGSRPSAFRRTFEAAASADKDRLRYAALDALDDATLRSWIDAAPKRRTVAVEVATAIAPADPAAHENEATEERLRSFSSWADFPYQLIIVPGYTPRTQAVAAPGVSPVGRERLAEAARAYAEKQAPFVFLTGGNVYPRGTPYHEGLEMKPVLVSLGVPADSIVVDARARHSTTNLRNAGRFMLAHGMKQALVTAPGGGLGPWDQAFYFAHAERSTFYARCERELGYRVGLLREAGDHRAAYAPSPDVLRVDYRDPLDP